MTGAEPVRDGGPPKARAGRGMVPRSARIQGNVLENLLDGVMVVERGGAIAMLNPAGFRILGLTPVELAGKSFSELFIEREGFDEFSEVLLNAVQETGESARRIVTVESGGETRSLSVATSYLRSPPGGTSEPNALIAVFSDITRLRKLRQAELRLARAVKLQHASLRTAYRQIEERNRALAATLKKVEVARLVATALVIAVFVAVGLHVWKPPNLFGDTAVAAVASAGDAAPGEVLRTVTVEPRPITETLALAGELAPWRTVPVMSPIESRVTAVHVRFGQEVAEGDLLVELDASDAMRDHRRARATYLEAVDAYEEVRNWATGPEMASARRAFAQARLTMESQETALERTEFLLGQGLIPASEHEQTKRRHRRQLLDFESVRQDLESVRARGSEKALDKAALKMRAAEEVMLDLDRRARESRVRAPASGVVLAAPGADLLAAGVSVDEGEGLLTIGDFSRMAAIAMVDEVDVVRTAVGQRVTVTGNAFRDLTLLGTVTHVSSQPVPRARGAARFRVVVTLDPLAASERVRLRAGMSSHLQIVVYHNEYTRVAPIEAVRRRGGANHLRVLDRATGTVSEREVVVGTTTVDSVEIVSGLQVGDEIVVPFE